MITVAEDIFDKIIEDCETSYPHECCGALMGGDGSEKIVRFVRKLTNINKERAGDRYEIDPKELLTAEKEAKKNGLGIVGFYHSHPDHPSRPSEFDRARGWPEYSYIIVAVEKGKFKDARSWTFTKDDEPFMEERLVIGG